MAKIAIITGSGSGIGRASALALLKNGYKVVLAGRRREALEETASMAGNNAPNALAVPTDVTSRESIQALFARTKQAFGRLDLIFNNAGISVCADARDLEISHWRKVIDVNLMGVVYGTHAAYQQMVKQGPGEAKEDQAAKGRGHEPGRRIEALGVSRRRQQPPGQKQGARIEGGARDSMGDGHHHGQHRAIDAQMRGERPVQRRIDGASIELGHLGSLSGEMLGLPNRSCAVAQRLRTKADPHRSCQDPPINAAAQS